MTGKINRQVYIYRWRIIYMGIPMESENPEQPDEDNAQSPVKKEKCPMCVAGHLGAAWSRNIILGKTAPVEIAQLLSMTTNEVMEHVNDHQIVFDEETEEYSSPDWYLNRLIKMIKTMDGWMTLFTETSKDKEAIKIGLQVIKETRATLLDMAELQGRVDRGKNVNVQIETMNVRYQQLTNVILQEVCDGCRARIIQLLDTQATRLPNSRNDSSVAMVSNGSEQ
jgi:hypothetical protein